jgi:hypothetical protein
MNALRFCYECVHGTPYKEKFHCARTGYDVTCDTDADDCVKNGKFECAVDETEKVVE